MTNRYYAPGADRAAKVGDLFAAVARRYDLINDLQSFGLHRCWKRRVADLAAPMPGEQALDLCCGTGDLTLQLARRGAAVTGLDFSEAMLEVASSKFKVQRSKFKVGDVPSSVQFLQGDAQAVPFPDASFDIVTVGYGLRNLSDWRRGLIEMHRVARPGGRLVVLDFGKPENPLWRWCYFAYLGWVVPVFGRLFCGDAPAYAYILESLQHYPAQRGVAEQMQAMECEDVRVVNLLGGAMSINFGRKPAGTAK